jgi:ribosomal protein S18 acetylase RimI-like enzyme
MIEIIKACKDDAPLLSLIAASTFIESHGASASKDDIDSYVTRMYSSKIIEGELADSKNIYYIIYHDKQPAGYSKIIFDSPYTGSKTKNTTKLDRLYLLKKFYNLKLGQALLQCNIELSKESIQSGMWLFVWKKNDRAILFYKRNGFRIIGSHDFRISERHTNPNHLMFLNYGSI